MFGFFVLAKFSHHIRVDCKELDHHSIPDFAMTRGFPIVSNLLTFSSWVFTTALVLLQIIIGGTLITKITGLPLEITAAGICASVGFYLFFGGYRALLNTDVIQALILLLVTIFFTYTIWLDVEFNGNVFVGPVEGVVPDILIFALGGFFAISGGPEIWQRVLTSESDRTASLSLIASGIIMLLWGCLLIVGALAIRAVLPNVASENALLDYLITQVDPISLGFMTLMLIAALMSTADTELFAGAVIVQKALKPHREKLSIPVTQLLIVVFLILSYLAAIQTPDLLDIYFALVYITFITGPIGMCLILGRGNYWSLGVSTAAGLIILVVLYASKNLNGWHPIFILMPTILPLLFRGSEGKRQLSSR